MNASGSGRRPGNFSSAASTSSVAASPSGSSPAASAFAFCRLFAAGDVGDELEQHVGRRRERHAVGQHLAQAYARRSENPPAHRARGSRRRPERDRCGKHAEQVADDIVEAGVGQIEVDMPGLLLGALFVEPRAGEEVARTGISREAGRGRRRERARLRCDLRRGAGGALLRLLVAVASACGRFPCPRHAKVQPLFLAR